MKLKKVMVHASLALCAAVALYSVIAGCGRRAQKQVLPEVYPAEGHGYMDDPEFKRQLAAQDAERSKVLGVREKICLALEDLQKKAGSKEAAEKTPEWRALEQQLQACLQTFETNRLRTAEMLRARMKRAMADSERIRRGEATAKKISK